jgi:hypothetical protein
MSRCARIGKDCEIDRGVKPKIAVKTAPIVDQLLRSDEPSIRWKLRAQTLGEDPASKSMRALQMEIGRSPRVQRLLAGRDSAGRLVTRRGVYDKWQGAHWVLAALADLGYPPGDMTLAPMRDQVMELWLADCYYKEFVVESKTDAYKREGVPVMRGRYRRCASQQGYTLYYLTRLGLADERAKKLVELLLRWQWPDGGWNCDKRPEADTSSFMETLLPMRGLAVHAEATGDKRARAAARRAAEILLERRLFKHRSDGKVIRLEFTQLHYPLYWHYDILGGLKGLAEAGAILDGRCADALDLLESKQLPDGGWAAEKRYHKTSSTIDLGHDYVDWGGARVKRMNPWVTADALAALRAAGRI